MDQMRAALCLQEDPADAANCLAPEDSLGPVLQTTFQQLAIKAPLNSFRWGQPYEMDDLKLGLHPFTTGHFNNRGGAIVLGRAEQYNAMLSGTAGGTYTCQASCFFNKGGTDSKHYLCWWPANQRLQCGS